MAHSTVTPESLLGKRLLFQTIRTREDRAAALGAFLQHHRCVVITHEHTTAVALAATLNAGVTVGSDPIAIVASQGTVPLRIRCVVVSADRPKLSEKVSTQFSWFVMYDNPGSAKLYQNWFRHSLCNSCLNFLVNYPDAHNIEDNLLLDNLEATYGVALDEYTAGTPMPPLKEDHQKEYISLLSLAHTQQLQLGQCDEALAELDRQLQRATPIVAQSSPTTPSLAEVTARAEELKSIVRQQEQREKELMQQLAVDWMKAQTAATPAPTTAQAAQPAANAPPSVLTQQQQLASVEAEIQRLRDQLAAQEQEQAVNHQGGVPASAPANAWDTTSDAWGSKTDLPQW